MEEYRDEYDQLITSRSSCSSELLDDEVTYINFAAAFRRSLQRAIYQYGPDVDVRGVLKILARFNRKTNQDVMENTVWRSHSWNRISNALKIVSHNVLYKIAADIVNDLRKLDADNDHVYETAGSIFMYQSARSISWPGEMNESTSMDDVNLPLLAEEKALENLNEESEHYLVDFFERFLDPNYQLPVDAVDYFMPWLRRQILEPYRLSESNEDHPDTVVPQQELAESFSEDPIEQDPIEQKLMEPNPTAQNPQETSATPYWERLLRPLICCFRSSSSSSVAIPIRFVENPELLDICDKHIGQSDLERQFESFSQFYEQRSHYKQFRNSFFYDGYTSPPRESSGAISSGNPNTDNEFDSAIAKIRRNTGVDYDSREEVCSRCRRFVSFIERTGSVDSQPVHVEHDREGIRNSNPVSRRISPSVFIGLKLNNPQGSNDGDSRQKSENHSQGAQERRKTSTSFDLLESEICSGGNVASKTVSGGKLLQSTTGRVVENDVSSSGTPGTSKSSDCHYKPTPFSVRRVRKITLEKGAFPKYYNTDTGFQRDSFERKSVPESVDGTPLSAQKSERVRPKKKPSATSV